MLMLWFNSTLSILTGKMPSNIKTNIPSLRPCILTTMSFLHKCCILWYNFWYTKQKSSFVFCIFNKLICWNRVLSNFLLSHQISGFQRNKFKCSTEKHKRHCSERGLFQSLGGNVGFLLNVYLRAKCTAILKFGITNTFYSSRMH